MKTAAVLIIAIVAQAIGDVCLTKGMKAIALGRRNRRRVV
jgi:hypothetical protein